MPGQSSQRKKRESIVNSTYPPPTHGDAEGRNVSARYPPPHRHHHHYESVSPHTPRTFLSCFFFSCLSSSAQYASSLALSFAAFSTCTGES